MTRTPYDGPMQEDETYAGLGQLTVAAIALHEQFTALLAAGFTEQQSIEIIVALVKG